MKATEREKALIFALAAGGVDSWKDAYLLSRDTATARTPTEPEKIRPIVTRWKQREEIQKAYQYATDILTARDQRNQEEGHRRALEEMKPGDETNPGDSERPARAKPGKVDYYNPDAQRDTINKIIQSSQDDPKTQLDAIKVIQQTQRDDRQAAKDNQIQRFYAPIVCQSCPLYAKRAKKG